MKKFFLALILFAAVFALVVWADYFYRFSLGQEENSLLAYILSSGEYLLNLVDKENTLQEYKPTDLVELAPLGAPGKYLRRPAYEQLAAMLKAAREDGVEIKIISAYRSFTRQQSIFSFYSRKYKEAARFSAQASHSEHQLGTAVDLGAADTKTDFSANFAQTPPGKWLAQNAFQYGFVMSYPAGKEVITGYIYEPWHYRYIGVEAAKEFRDSGLTLKEFLAKKPQYYQEGLPLE